MNDRIAAHPLSSDYADGSRWREFAPIADDGEPAVAPLHAFGTTALPIEYDGEISPVFENRYLIKGLLGTRTLSVIFGLPAGGKSFLSYDVARHIARGADWFGRRTRQGRVVYLAGEGQGGLRVRHAAWDKAHPATGRDPFALIPTAVDLLDPKADLPKLRATLDQFVGRFGGLDLLIIDTLSATFGGGNENGPDMAAYVGNVQRLCGGYGCSALVVTHAPLDATAKRPRGHSSLWGAADTVFQVSGDRDAPARRIRCIKQKDGDPGPDIMFKLVPVDLGTDEDGDPVTSCFIEQSDLEPAAVVGKRRLTHKEMIVKESLGRALEAAGCSPPKDIPENVLNRFRTDRTVRTSDWRREALAALASPDTKPDTARRTFDRARESLQASEIIGVWEDWAWLVF